MIRIITRTVDYSPVELTGSVDKTADTHLIFAPDFEVLMRRVTKWPYHTEIIGFEFVDDCEDGEMPQGREGCAVFKGRQ